MHHAPMPESAALAWQRRLAPYQGADDRKAAFQLITTTLLFVAGWWLAYEALSISYWLTLAIAVPLAGLQTRLFIFQHDCGHGSFFRSQRLNNMVGRVIGVLMLTPYAYWRRTHAIHHATAGDLDRREFGDIATLTVREYLARGLWGRIGYRIYRNIFLLLTFGPIYQFIIKHRLPLDTPRSWKKEWASVMGTNLALVGVLALAWATIGIKALILVQLPVTLFSAGFGLWLFYVQHQFEDTYWREHPEWELYRAGIEGSSYYDLGPVLHWFTGNIGYHHVHHLASRIPNYRLRKCFEEVPELHRVTRLTFWSSLRCARLALWDEQRQKLITFSEIHAEEASLPVAA